ncbi:MAG: trigger factor [Eubacteriales bacterium]|nr:trigger factor [Eubacteriales bacterium]
MKKQRLGAIILTGALMLGLTSCGTASTTSAYKKYVTLGDYKKIEYTKTVQEVTDADVQSQVDSFVRGLAEKTEITDRAVQDGDIVNIDYVGTKDGVAFDGGTAKGFDLTIGSHMFIDGFEEGLIGHNIGEEVSLDLKFPEEYKSEELAGAAVNFAVTINSISESKEPELTDDLVKDNTDYSTIADYKQSIKDKLIEQNEENAETGADADIFSQVLANATISGYDEEEVKKLVDDKFEEFKGYTQQYQCTYEELLEAFGFKSEDELMEGITEYVKKYLDEKMVVYCIADAEGIKVTSEDIKAAAQADADLYGAKMEEVLKFNGEDYYEFKLLSDQVKALLRENAVLVDSTEEKAETTEAAE